MLITIITIIIINTTVFVIMMFILTSGSVIFFERIPLSAQITTRYGVRMYLVMMFGRW